jgi:hypothetical protein
MLRKIKFTSAVRMAIESKTVTSSSVLSGIALESEAIQFVVFILVLLPVCTSKPKRTRHSRQASGSRLQLFTLAKIQFTGNLLLAHGEANRKFQDILILDTHKTVREYYYSGTTTLGHLNLAARPGASARRAARHAARRAARH